MASSATFRVPVMRTSSSASGNNEGVTLVNVDCKPKQIDAIQDHLRGGNKFRSKEQITEFIRTIAV
ncbi:MAG: hypothetical protein WC648_03775 [Candidatus Paceibacterota bacterium]